MDTPIKMSASYYSSHMLESVEAVYLSYLWSQEQSRLEDEGTSEAYDAGVSSGIFARYAFFTACIAIESGANALLEQSPGVGKSLYRDLEKLTILNKFELFALLHKKPLDRGADIYGKMKEVVGLRNSFFHPKETWVELSDQEPRGIIDRRAGGREYPTALDFLDCAHALELVGDMLRFAAWVPIDVCGISVQESARMISRGVVSTTATLRTMESDFGYDIRSFGYDE